MAAESKSVKITETKHLLLNGSPKSPDLSSRWVGRWHRVDGGTPQGRFTGTGVRGKDFGRFGKGGKVGLVKLLMAAIQLTS